MANYNTIGAYDAQSRIPSFCGLMQYGDGQNGDPRYAVDAVNVDTRGGVLQPVAQCTCLSPVTPAPIESLALLHRRWHVGNGSPDILVAASGGKLYAMAPDDASWTELEMPDGVEAYASNVWSCVSYEINPEGSAASVDVLLLSNAEDGMVMVRGDTLAVETVATPKKFGVIERYAERIWGGAITEDPDQLVYSAPYGPTNWEANAEIPEDGAGDISQPSWDGDRFTALRAFGSQLIAFKRTRVWRILGTDPGEYTFKEQYGGGAPYEGTIAVDTERILMLDDQGPVVYDGLAVSPFCQEVICETWKRVNKSALSRATAAIWQGRYYCAVPVDGSGINSAVLVYNPVDGTWLIRDDVSVERFLATEDALYFTSTNTPGQIWLWQEDSWETGTAAPSAVKWVSPWNDLGYRTIVKSGFEVYFLCEVQDSPVTLKISIQTEKKTKTKTYTVQPLTDTQRGLGQEHRQKRLRFGGSGRRFRLIIECEEGSTAPWRLIGGVLINLESDPD